MQECRVFHISLRRCKQFWSFDREEKKCLVIVRYGKIAITTPLYINRNCGRLICECVHCERVFENELALLSIDNRSAETETEKKVMK